jgi:hypothetical protein
MHMIISHTFILNSASTAAHTAVVHLNQQSARLVTAAPRLSRPVIAGMYVRGDSPLGQDICAGESGRRSARNGP